MRTRPVLAILTTAAALAGCLGDGDGPGDGPAPPGGFDPAVLSQAQHAILPPEETWVASSVDGKLLHNAVYRPDTNVTVPAFINFSPYWGDTAMDQGDNFARYLINEYVPRGYAVVLSAVRGTGHSQGCFQIGGDLELQDAHDVVDFFASQEWSNGNVGTGGKSYDSTTQNGMIAKFPHPALKAAFHVSGITDMYRYNYYDGVPYANGLQFTPRYYLTQGLDEYLGATSGAGGVQDEDPESLARIVDDAACPEFPEHVASGEGSAATGLKDAYWQERDWTQSIAASSWNGSLFFVHGLQDWNVKPDHVLPWLDHLPPAVKVLGWLHQETFNLGHVYPMREDWNQTMLRWLDHTLKGKDTGMDALWGYEVQGSDGLWRRSEAWPEAHRAEAEAGAGGATFAADAACAGCAGRISGRLLLNVTATPLAPDAVLTAVVTTAAGEWVTEAVLRGIYREGLASPAPLVPGMAATFPLVAYPVDHVLAPGEELVVTFGATPRETLVTPAQLAAVQYAGGTLAVPVAGPATLGLLDEQPAGMSCFAC